MEPVDEQELTTLEDSVVQKLDQEGVVEAETPEKPIVANPIIEEVPVRVEPEVSTLDAAGQEWPGLGDSKCYVIVGAFGVSSNVDRMIDRLEGMGYGVATMPNRGLTQVGVTSTCDSLQIDKVLEDMRANVEAQAWIYKR